MKYIKVSKKVYRSSKTQSLETSYVGGHIDSQWVAAKPELLQPNLKERFIHSVLRKHFSFGQPYCVVCGKEEFSQIIPDNKK